MKLAATILLVTATMIGVAIADEDDNYIDCVLNTAAKSLRGDERWHPVSPRRRCRCPVDLGAADALPPVIGSSRDKKSPRPKPAGRIQTDNRRNA